MRYQCLKDCLCDCKRNELHRSEISLKQQFSLFFNFCGSIDVSLSSFLCIEKSSKWTLYWSAIEPKISHGRAVKRVGKTDPFPKPKKSLVLPISGLTMQVRIPLSFYDSMPTLTSDFFLSVTRNSAENVEFRSEILHWAHSACLDLLILVQRIYREERIPLRLSCHRQSRRDDMKGIRTQISAQIDVTERYEGSITDI